MRDLIPWGRTRAHALQRPPSDARSALSTWRREMDRLFDDAFGGFGLSAVGEGGLNWPRVEVTDGERHVRVTAALQGFEEQDVELRVEDNVLILRGEKRTEFDDAEQQYSERSFRRFARQLALPADVDEERASATFRNGVLTVTLPKREGARQQVKRIPISH